MRVKTEPCPNKCVDGWVCNHIHITQDSRLEDVCPVCDGDGVVPATYDVFNDPEYADYFTEAENRGQV